MALGFRGHSLYPRRPQHLHPRLRGRQALRRADAGKAEKGHRGGSSEPPGPGKNSAGLAIFRYETSAGQWGHTGNFFGYTQFAAASEDGRRSVTVSINAQHTLVSGSLVVFEALRRAEEGRVRRTGRLTN